MIAYACRQISFKPEQIKNINKIYEKDQNQAFEQMNEIFSIINKVEAILKQKTHS
jgi:DNA-directed RNA polymerase subunit F